MWRKAAVLTLILTATFLCAAAHAQHQRQTFFEDYYDPAVTANAPGGSDWVNASVQNLNQIYTAGASQGPVTINGVATTSAVFTVRAIRGVSQIKVNPYWTIRDALEGEAVAVAADSINVYAVGWTNAGLPGSVDFGTAFSVRAYSARTGALLWKDDFIPNPQVSPACAGFNRALAVAVKSGRLFVAGVVENPTTGLDFVLRAYAATTGVLSYMVTEKGGDNTGVDKANAVATNGTVVVVAGTLTDNTGNNLFAVKEYSALNGSVVWTNLYNPKVNTTEGPFWSEAKDVVMDTSASYVVGLTQTLKDANYGPDSDWTVRAFPVCGLRTVNPRWNEDYDRGTAESAGGATPGGNDGALSVALDKNILYVAGYVADKYSGAQPGTEDTDLALRVYYAASGKPVWWDYADGVLAGGNQYGDDMAKSVAVNGTRVYVGGFIESIASDKNAYTVSYPIANKPYTPPKMNPSTGQYGNAVRPVMSWQDVYDGGSGGNDEVNAVSAYGSRVFAGGTTENRDGNLDFATCGLVGP